MQKGTILRFRSYRSSEVLSADKDAPSLSTKLYMLAINFSNGCYFSVRLRAYRSDDAPRLADIANDPAVPRWMTARFPHPYSLAAAQEWVGRAGAESPIDNFAIEVDGELAGGIGITPQGGEIAGVAEFGYWLGRAYWGRGIATQAAAVVVTYAFAERQLRRLEAHVFAPNLASIRVLEKNGFRREAILRERYVERDGTIVDGLVYARLRSGS